jgi:hypothetical protein
LLDARPLNDPLVGGVNRFAEFLVGEDARGYGVPDAFNDGVSVH